MQIYKTFFVATLVCAASVAQAATPKVAAQLLAVEREDSILLGVHLTIPDRAHIYWHNPGSSGLATNIDWELPDGVSVGPVQWPAPSRFDIPEIDDTSFGYEHEVVLFAEVVQTSPSPLGTTLEFGASIQWLLCLEDGQCIPGKATLRLAHESGSAPSDRVATLMDSHRANVPVSGEKFIESVVLHEDHGALVVSLKSPWMAHEASEPPAFFPNEDEAWNYQPRDPATAHSIRFSPAGMNTNPSGGVLIMSVSEGAGAEPMRVRIAVPADIVTVRP